MEKKEILNYLFVFQLIWLFLILLAGKYYPSADLFGYGLYAILAVVFLIYSGISMSVGFKEGIYYPLSFAFSGAVLVPVYIYLIWGQVDIGLGILNLILIPVVVALLAIIISGIVWLIKKFF